MLPYDDVKVKLWYERHLMPHEAMLRAWLRSKFEREFEIDDIVQEAYMRVLQARETTDINSPKAFLFATARNVALGKVKKQRSSGEFSLGDLDELGILDEQADVFEEIARSEELELLTRAVQSLPVRCRQIVTLRKIYGMPQREIARELGISEKTVEAQSAIGMKKMTKFFRLILRGWTK